MGKKKVSKPLLWLRFILNNSFFNVESLTQFESSVVIKMLSDYFVWCAAECRSYFRFYTGFISDINTNVSKYIKNFLFQAEIKESSFSAFNNFLWAGARMVRELISLLNLNTQCYRLYFLLFIGTLEIGGRVYNS